MFSLLQRGMGLAVSQFPSLKTSMETLWYDNTDRPPKQRSLVMRRKRSERHFERQAFFRKFSPLSSHDLLCGTKRAIAKQTFTDKSSRPLIFDPTGRESYCWLAARSLAVLYFTWSIVLRLAFPELHYRLLWLVLDMVFEIVYMLDIFVQMRTSYLREGILEDDLEKMRLHYQETWRSRLDALAALPFGWLYAILMLRLPPAYLHAFKLLKHYCVKQFFERTESRSHYPNVFRVLFIMQNLLIAIHWNACIYFLLSRWIGFGSDQWVYPSWNQTTEWGSLSRQYIYCFYWSTLTLTTIGELAHPETNIEYVFMTVAYLVGMLMFATLVGNIGNIIANMQTNRTKFQSQMDQIKWYMKSTQVPNHLQERVIKWFDYLWLHGHRMDDQQALNALPDKLKAEIGIHVHFDTLKKVDFFEECDHGLLWELVLRLRTQIYSPGELVCRKGDVGREMYIVNTGRLEVLNEEDGEVIRELSHGDYFGEISVLNLGASQRRRTAFVRSLGYSTLLYLSQADLNEVLQDYPKTRQKLVAEGERRLGQGSAEAEPTDRDILDQGFLDCDEQVDEVPPIQLQTVADQIVDVRTRLGKLEGILHKLVREIKKDTTPNMHPKRKISCQM